MACMLLVLLLCVYATCSLFVADAFTSHPDAPTGFFGVKRQPGSFLNLPSFQNAMHGSQPKSAFFPMGPATEGISTTPQADTRRASPCSRLWAAKRTMNDDDDIDADAWEPDDEDLMLEDDFDDLEVDDEDEDIDQDDEIVSDASSGENDDDDDDDDDDVDLDPWDEDEDDDEIQEELVGIQATGIVGDDLETDEDNIQDEYEFDDDYDGDEDYPLEDDPNDPDYQTQKQLVEETVARREELARDKNFDAIDFMMNQMTLEQAEAMDKLPFIQEATKMEEDLIILDDDDVKDINLEEELPKVTDFMEDDPYENEGKTNILGTGISDDDLEELDNAWKDITRKTQEESWDKVTAKDLATDWYALDNQTLTEMDACLEEIGGSAYNCTRWLLYDLDFNVTNLILAAVKHNRQAPILFQHWYPQLLTYERYQHARDRDFDFNWEDVEQADISELERYYSGFGYSEIPKKAPAETGIISLEDLDEEELRMAAFENWMIEVYNPEVDRLDFDDDDFRDEDNVYSKFYEAPQHPDLPSYEDTQEDLEMWEEEMGDNEEDREYKELYGREFKYKVAKDEEFEKEFRGHLVVACSPDDADLEIAEIITARMDQEFGKKVYVETRVMAHAREEDSVFEVWLESYEIDLLHSKRRATLGSKGWEGPAECDAAQIDYIVEEVRFLISDDARYSYRREMDIPV